MDHESKPEETYLMGQLRCLVEKDGRRRLSGYKKRFWVVNTQSKRLEVYKNDQSHEPSSVFRAQDIRGVLYTGDKQNKFYLMIVQTRLRTHIKFRMRSLEERQRWSQAITELIDAFSATHQRRNIFQFLQRRTRAVARSLHVNITVDWPRILTAPQETLEYTVEAIDAALANVMALMRNYGTEYSVPHNYTLNLQTLETAPEEGEDFPGPQYDPVKKSAVLHVVLYKNGQGHVRFWVTEPEMVLTIMQSNVFRSPLIEGWIDTAPGCAEACERIRATLNMTTRSFPITFQWGQNLSDADAVEDYLRRFVNEDFFMGLLAGAEATVRDVERMLEDLLAPTSTGVSPAVSPRAQTAGGVLSPGVVQSAAEPGADATQADGVAHRSSSDAAIGAVAHLRSFSATVLLPPNSVSAGAAAGGAGGGGGVGSSASSTSATSRHAAAAASGSASVGGGAAGPPGVDIRAMAVKLISDSIAGLAITLERRVVEECRRPPEVMVTHAVEYDTRCRPAFLLAAKYRQVFAQALQRQVSLHDQLFEVAFNSLLTRQFAALRTRMNAVFDKKTRVTVQWDQLFEVFRRLSVPLFPRDLPKLINAIGDVCLPRVENTVQILSTMRAERQTAAGPSGPSSGGGSGGSPVRGGGQPGSSGRQPAAPAGVLSSAGRLAGTGTAEEDETSVLDVFRRSSGGIVIDFCSYADAIVRHGGSPQHPTTEVAAAAMPEPHMRMGALVDTFLCADELTSAAMVNAVNQLRGSNLRQAPLLAHGVHICASMPRLSTWCESYFTAPEHMHAVARTEVEDEFDSESDAGTADSGLDMDTGEAVANERSAEIAVLNTKRVVNTVYDSQGEAIDLKISAQDIRRAIGSLQGAFPGRKVTKHDIARVLTLNLRRLRSLFSRAADDDAANLLTEKTMYDLLRSFCEYKANEAHIIAAMEAYDGRRLYRRVARSAGTEPAGSGFLSSSGGNYNSNDTSQRADLHSSVPSTLAARVPTAVPSRAGTVAQQRAARMPADDALARSVSLKDGPPSVSEPSPQQSESIGDGLERTCGPAAAPTPELRPHEPLNPNADAGAALAAGSDGAEDADPQGGSRSPTMAPCRDEQKAAQPTAHEPISISSPLAQLPSPSSSPLSQRLRGTTPEQNAEGGAKRPPSKLSITLPTRAFSEAEFTEGEQLYDFRAFSYIALNTLLPREAVVARRAWRTGFIFGLESSGKSHVVNCLRCLPRPTVATVGLSHTVVAFEEWVLSLHELGGRDSFRKNWRFYARRLEHVHFLLHVVDCSNRNAYEEGIKYMKKVALHFKYAPLLVVFNNYQYTPLPKSLATMCDEYDMDRIQKINPKRVLLACRLEVSVIHQMPKSSAIPKELHSTMQRLSSELRNATRHRAKPMVPKESEVEIDPSSALQRAGGQPDGTTFVSESSPLGMRPSDYPSGAPAAAPVSAPPLRSQRQRARSTPLE